MQDAPGFIPVLRYRDVGKAARWLCAAFSFSERRLVYDASGGVSYILLTFGRGTVLIRPVSDSEFDDLMAQPDDVGETSTQVCYVAVSGLDAHWRRARAAGARIELAPQRDGLGGSFYSCRDLEGHLWSFGTQDHRAATRMASRHRSGFWLASQFTSVMVVAALAVGTWASLDSHLDRMKHPEPVTASAATSGRNDIGADVLASLERTTAELDRVRRENARLVASAVSATSQDQQQRAALERAGVEIASLQAGLALERKARDVAVEDAAKAVQQVKALRGQFDQQEQQRRTAQEQLQIMMAALVDVQREAEPGEEQSSIQTGAISVAAPPRDDAKRHGTAPPRAIKAPPGEAAACYRQLMGGNINWGGGTEWLPSNAEALCSGSRNARQTIDCFEARIRAKRPWREAVNACRAS
jgi:uncharacterized glyoxalase superfamily protein PhnB